MRTLVLSDLHLGNGGPYDIFAGGGELAALLDAHADSPTRVVLNGDTFDFLLNDDPLRLDPAQAVRQAVDLLRGPSTEPTLAALGRVLAAGGEAVLVVGNHDLELALPEVQDVIREALRQPREVALRLRFHAGTAPLLLREGGASVLVTHGDHADDGNRIDYNRFLASGPDARRAFEYPPGSLLVKSILNPLKRRFGLRYMDLLKPDFEGAVLTALGTRPGALAVLLQAATLRVITRFLQNRTLPMAFPAEEGPPSMEDVLTRRILEAALTEEESRAIGSELEDPASFDMGEVLVSARLKLARAGLRLYARAHRALADRSGREYFELAPESTELTEARRLARAHGAQAVIMGHTHSARWFNEDGLTYANTGTWIWLLRLPDPDAGDDTWADFLRELQQNPGLLAERQKLARLERRLTCVRVETAGTGCTMTLGQWEGGSFQPLASTHLSP